jgi:hypothetical protein
VGPAPDPAIFLSDLQEAKKNNLAALSFYAYSFTFTSFFTEKKVIKKSQNSRNKSLSSFS